MENNHMTCYQLKKQLGALDSIDGRGERANSRPIGRLTIVQVRGDDGLD